jgi:hypothetical protein
VYSLPEDTCFCPILLQDAPALGVAANDGVTPNVNATAIEIAKNFFILSPKRFC